MWLDGECVNQIVYRSAVIGRRGIVSSAEVTAAMGYNVAVPDLTQLGAGVD